MLVLLTSKRGASASSALSSSSFSSHLVHQGGAYTGRRPAGRYLSFACGFFRRSVFPATNRIKGSVGSATLYRLHSIYTKAGFGCSCIELQATGNSRSTAASRFRSPAMQRKDHGCWWILSAATVSLICTCSLRYSYCTGTTAVMALSSNSAASTKNNSKSNNPMLPKSSIFASLQLDNSWPRLLSPETPENLQKSRLQERLTEHDDNRTKRPVFNGHYVLVKPTGLKDPKLLLVSKDVAHNLLQLSDAQMDSEDFVQFVSGNVGLEESWATPYALSIMGTRYQSNCPYGTGNGYGDGRAISIAEWNGYELQLKVSEKRTQNCTKHALTL
jgi:hypothetical protein